MTLTAGKKLGPYEVVSAIGAGGMGEVYRAVDSRLGRDVAVKVLPSHLSSDLASKARFEREAKTISALNHPHICTLYDVGSQDGLGYLVMEFLDGHSLAKVLEKGPLPLPQVLKIGREIADALDKAHRCGIIHRDLKPGNVMLTKSGAKLLDFGLACSTISSPVVSLSTATTELSPRSPITEEGSIVGTFQYMSPEQVEGKEADARSDIFSLGAVLYEMLTGQRAFQGKSQLSVASAILEREPAPISSFKPLTPPAFEHTVSKCLAKNPDDRWQSTADVKHELDWISQSSTGSAPVAAPSQQRSRTPVIPFAGAALVLLALAGIAGSRYVRTASLPSGPVVRATLPSLPNITLLTLSDQAGAPAISRDGANVVFSGLADGKKMLFLRPLDSTTANPLPGTEDGKFPFWSPDGKSVGFFADRQLKRLDLAGGPPTVLATAPDGRGGSWAGDTIIFTPYIYDTLYRIPASGGQPVAITKLDRNLHTTHRWPYFLPDGKHFLYLAAHHMSGKEGNSGVYVGSIDAAAPTFLFHTNGSVFYASGELLFYRDGSLMAQGFDPKRLQVNGDAKSLGDVLRESGNWGVIASASDNGVLLFQSPGKIKYPVMWFDRTAKTIGPAPFSGLQMQDIRLSPDGTRAAYAIAEGLTGQVYVFDLRTGARTRLSFEESVWFLAWSPDGTRIVYSTNTSGTDKTDMCIKRADGAGNPELLLSSGNLDHPTDWTRDGRYIVFNRGQFGDQRIWVMPLFGNREPFPLFPNSAYDHGDGRVSPNGKWIAYFSAESGRSEIYITSFPDGVGRWQVSNNGIVPAAVWRSDGKELYYVNLDGNLMVARIQELPGSISIANVEPLFRSAFATGIVRSIFDVDPKGAQRFIGAAEPDTNALPINVITNWTAGTKTK